MVTEGREAEGITLACTQEGWGCRFEGEAFIPERRGAIHGSRRRCLRADFWEEDVIGVACLRRKHLEATTEMEVVMQDPMDKSNDTIRAQEAKNPRRLRRRAYFGVPTGGLADFLAAELSLGRDDVLAVGYKFTARSVHLLCNLPSLRDGLRRRNVRGIVALRRLEMATWFTADLHLGHYRIVRFCGRPFASADEMDAVLMANWCTVVAPDDDIWVLGDFCFRSSKSPQSYLSRLPGRKHLVTGNHDKAETLKAPGWDSGAAVSRSDGRRDKARPLPLWHACLARQP